MKLKCIVVDDEFMARQYLKDYIQKVPFLSFEGEYSSPLLIINELNNNNIDILFLDIQMPEITGIDFLKSVKKLPHIIITTAYKEYALEGYELNVTDYLLKPFSFERFLKSVNKIYENVSKFELKSNMPDIEENSNELHCNTDYLIIKADRKLYRVLHEDIIFIEGQKSYVTFHISDKKITALVTMKELEECLPSDKFIRIHKSYIVSIKNIETLEGNQVYVKGYLLPIGLSYRSNVENLFLN